MVLTHSCKNEDIERQRERGRDFNSASLTFEGGSVFMSGPFAAWLEVPSIKSCEHIQSSCRLQTPESAESVRCDHVCPAHGGHNFGRWRFHVPTLIVC